mgnify:CR=1 FL=1
MSDRELLTLAAKTAGIELWTRSDPWHRMNKVYCLPMA